MKLQGDWGRSNEKPRAWIAAFFSSSCFDVRIYGLRRMAVLSGAQLSGEAERKMKNSRCSGAPILSVSLSSLAFIAALRAQPSG